MLKTDALVPVTGVQVIPSFEYAISFVPVPTATHLIPFQATPFPCVKNKEFPTPVQFIPLLEVAIVFVPSPTATKRFPFQATPLPPFEKIERLLGTAVQLIPSAE